MPGRTLALPNVCYALPPIFQKDSDALIEQSVSLFKQSVNIICYVNNIWSLLHCDIITDTIIKGIIDGAIGIKKQVDSSLSKNQGLIS